MLARDLATYLRSAVGETERALIGINHSDTGAGMYGVVLVTQMVVTISPSGERVLLLSGAAQCSPDDESIEDEQKMLAHPDLMTTNSLCLMMEHSAWAKLRVFHTLDHGHNNPEIYASESEFWEIVSRITPAGPRAAAVDMMRDEDKQRKIDYPIVVDLWNGSDHFHID